MDRQELQRLAKVRQWCQNGRAREIRQGARLSMVEMGAQVGVDDSTISRWESGRRTPAGNPALAYAEALEALAEVIEDDEPCEDCGEFGDEHFGPTGGSVTNAPWNGAASRFSDEQYQMACAVCDQGDGTVKERCHLPHHEPGGSINRNGVHAAAGRLGSIGSGDKSAAAAHLRSHYTKDLNEDPPPSLEAALAGEPFADPGMKTCPTCKGSGKILNGNRKCPTCNGSGQVPDGDSAARPSKRAALALSEQFPQLTREALGSSHGSHAGTHSHMHSAYGTQGGDATHDHSHTHNTDNTHNHHVSTVTQSGGGAHGFRPDMLIAGGSFRREADEYSAADAVQWQTLLRSHLSASGSPLDLETSATWVLRQEPDGWHVGYGRLTADGEHATWDNPLGSYREAVAAIGEQLHGEGLAATLPDGWRSEMAYEGVSTGDGRYIEPGAIQYRNTPLPLMLQTTTEQGHYGAVLAGAINQTGMLGQTAVGAGDFDSSDAGRQALNIITARGRFGVSIDVAEAEGEPVCTEHGPNLADCDLACDWEAHFSLIKVMGLTMTPFPAFADAYIELAAQSQPASVAASGAPEETDESGEHTFETELIEEGVDPVVAAAATVARDGALTLACPASWFAPPKFTVGDGRLVRQESGGFACPLTVDPPDAKTGLRRVYGHVADRLTCHTGVVDRCQLVPRSRSGYAAFNLRPVGTVDGAVVKVGHLTMGIGHASVKPGMTADAVRAHYDGGPGALRMAYVTAGDDEYGPWVAGVIVPERTSAQIRDFAACSLSGDWREVWRGRGLELVACLAGVTVPGFPIAAAALVAAGVHVPAVPEIGTPRAGYRDDIPVALVAAGVVRPPMPWEKQLARLESVMEDVSSWQRGVDATLKPLRPMAAAMIKAELEAFAAPTPQDKSVMAALVSARAALVTAAHAQAGDPDNGSDPDDSAVNSGIGHALAVLSQVIADQAKDLDPERAGANGSS